MSASTSTIGPVSQQYAAAATVPLIKSPSLWLPRQVELPPDIHPLPEDITAYFVYPFSLEHHVLSLHPSPHDAITQRRARNAAILSQREEAEERRERDALHKIAPGYNPTGFLLPTSTPKSAPAPTASSASASSAAAAVSPTSPAQRDLSLSDIDFSMPSSSADANAAAADDQHGARQAVTSARPDDGSTGGQAAKGDSMDDLVSRLEGME